MKNASALVVLVVGFAIQTSLAFGQSNEVSPARLAMAQQLYAEADDAMKAERYVEACPKLERVTDLVPKGVGGHGKLGECYEAVDRLGSAWEQYTTAQALAYAQGDRKRADEMAAKAKALEPRVARITISVPKEVMGLVGLIISRNGLPVEKALWNTPIPVDAREHVIEVKAPDRETKTQKVMILADGAMMQVNVLPGKIVTGTIPTQNASRTWQRPLGWSFLGLGGASLATTAILSGLAVGKKNASNADKHCKVNNECDGVGLDLRDQALSLANGATATVAIGGVLAAAGLIVVLAAPKENKERERPGKTSGLSLRATVSPLGVGLQGTW